MRLAVVIPAYQAAATLAEVILRLDPYVAREFIWVIDDGSRDGTGEVARTLRVNLGGFAANRGKGHALADGFRRSRDADVVLTLDADGQHPPECLPAFLAAAGSADIVVGCRQRAANMPAARRVANWASSRWATWLAGQPVGDSQSGYRLYARRVIDEVPAGTGGYEWESRILVRAAQLGFRLGQVEIPTVYGEETSHLNPFRDAPRIVGTLARLSWEKWVPPAELRDARARMSVPGR